jgi:hypothetical protein
MPDATSALRTRTGSRIYLDTGRLKFLFARVCNQV